MKRAAAWVLGASTAPFWFAWFACFGVGCGSNEPAPAAPLATASATPPASASATPPASEPEPAKRRKPFEVHTACADVVTIAFGEDPKSPAGGKRAMAPSSSIEGERNADGNQTVWLLDANGEPLVKVNVTRGMKRVEVGRSCRTLDAR